MHGEVEYVEIQAPSRFVSKQRYCDENGAPARHPMAPVFPETILRTVEFAEEGPGSTRVTVTWEPDGATPEEIAAFAKGRGGMTSGWGGSFDKLDEALASSEKGSNG